jgi:hypothetical protein
MSSSLLVHRVRCVPLPISAPASVAFSPRGTLMAVLRDDATLEIWNRTLNSFTLETVRKLNKNKRKFDFVFDFFFFFFFFFFFQSALVSLTWRRVAHRAWRF